MDRGAVAWLSQLAPTQHSLVCLRRVIACWCVMGLPLAGFGCAQFAVTAALGDPPAIVRASGAEPAPEGTEQAAPLKALAINLDSVLRLAEGQNAQVAVARARVQEAYAEKDVASLSWLPSFNVGTAYYRHEGGITNEDGANFGRLAHASFSTLFAGLEITSKLDLREAVFQRVNAERQLWQHKGELRKITSETLVDASSTYVDILAARTGEAIAMNLQKDLEAILERAQKLASTEPGARVEVARIQAQLKGREQTTLELREQAARASAKLVYLLGLDPSSILVPIDNRLVAFELVDGKLSASDLIAQALANGPGIREMEGLLSLIHESNERAKGPGKYLPVFESRMIEGGFGTGPGDRMDWENRWDFGLQARWNLTELLTARDRQRILQAKTDQAHLIYQDLRGKLAAGVQEAREAILSGRDQIRLGEEQIQQAQQAYKLSDERLKNNITGSSSSEVLLSLQAVGAAQASYVNAIRSYDKAQLRLMVLLGAAGSNDPSDGNCPKRCGKSQ